MEQEQIDCLKNLIDDAGYQWEDYNGRLGVTARDPKGYEVIADLIEATQGDYAGVMQLAEALREVHVKPLGMGFVLYFPSYQLNSQSTF